MDFLIDFVFELIVGSIVYISANKKISKWIRYPLIMIVVSFYLGLITLFIWLGIKEIKDNILIAIIFLIIGLIILFICIKAFIKIYLSKQNYIDDDDNYEKNRNQMKEYIDNKNK